MVKRGAPLGFAPPERFLDCVHCGLCLTACPTYLETGLEADSPRGRLYLMRGLNEGTLAPTTSVTSHLDLCLACRACEPACPSGVHYGEVIEAARAALEPYSRRPLGVRVGRVLVARVVAHPRGQRWLAILARVLPRRWLAAAARQRRIPIALRRRAALLSAFPTPARVELPARLDPPGPVRGTVLLFTGCLAQTFFADTNLGAARLLARAGFRVHVPPEPLCCGALLHHLGRAAEARRIAARTAAALAALGGDAIAVTAAGCGAMLRSYGALLGAAAAPVAARTHDVLALLHTSGLPAPPHPIHATVTYHDACHLAHAQGVTAAPRDLLRTIPGLELTELVDADHCCGSAGTYNLTEPAMASRLLDRKIERVLATGATMVAAANAGCIVQIRAGLAYRGAAVAVLHPIDLLAAAHFGTARAVPIDTRPTPSGW